MSNTHFLNKTPSVIFFGSFLDYSALVLDSLIAAHQQGLIQLVAVVTTPAKPAGRKKELRPMPVQLLAEKHNLAVFTPEHLQERESLTQLPPADFFVTAGYGKLLPPAWLEAPRQHALNIHFSLLPAYRGANPAEWALLRQETLTGISVIEMSPTFDTGAVLAQAALAIEPNDTRESLYLKLYQLAAEEVVPAILGPNSDFDSNLDFFDPPQVQPDSPTPYARRLTRADSWISQRVLAAALPEVRATFSDSPPTLTEADFSPFLWDRWQEWQAWSSLFQEGKYHADSTFDLLQHFLATAQRALAGFPGLWTELQTKKGLKRAKLLDISFDQTFTLRQAQLEGQQATAWENLQPTIFWN